MFALLDGRVLELREDVLDMSRSLPKAMQIAAPRKEEGRASFSVEFLGATREAAEGVPRNAAGIYHSEDPLRTLLGHRGALLAERHDPSVLPD